MKNKKKDYKKDKSVGSDVWIKEELENYFYSMFSILVKLTFPETKLDEERHTDFSSLFFILFIYLFIF